MEPQVESGVQFYSRIKKSGTEVPLNNINPKLFQPGSPNPGEIIAITGDFVKDLLLDLIVRSILPLELNPEWKSSGVVFVNTTHHINILNITNVIDAHLKKLKLKNRRAVVEKALTLVTMLDCYNEDQIEITLRNLENVIIDRENVNLVIMDDISSEFWAAKNKEQFLSLEAYSKQNFQLLHSIVKSLNIVLVFSYYQLGHKRTIDLAVDYKIIGEEVDSTKKFIAIDCVKKTTTIAPFHLETFIDFT